MSNNELNFFFSDSWYNFFSTQYNPYYTAALPDIGESSPADKISQPSESIDN